MPVILILAAGLRLFALDQIDVRYDEAVAPIFAHEVAQGIWHQVVPFSGSVARHPALWLYILALPYLFTTNFYIIAGYRVLLDVIAVAATWLLGARYFNRRVAMLSALLFAVSPWAVHLSRKLWTAPLALWSVIALIGLLEIAQRRNPKGWLVALWGVSFAIGTHLAAIYVLPVFALVALLFRRTLRWRWVGLGLLPAVMIAAAYVAYDAQHAFVNICAMLFASSPSTIGSAPLRFAFWLSGGAHLSDLTGSAILQWQWQNAWAFEWIDEVQMWWLLLALLLPIYLAFKNGILYRHKAGDLFPPLQVGLFITFIWWLLPILAHLRHPEPFQVHYVSPLYPAPFVLMAFFADYLWGRAAGWGWGLNGVWRFCNIALVLGVFGWQIFTIWRFGNFMASHETGGYRAVAPALRAAQLARENANEVIVVVPNADPAVNEEAAILHFVLLGQAHRFSDANAGLIGCGMLRCNYLLGPGGPRIAEYLAPNSLQQIPIDQRYSLTKLSQHGLVFKNMPNSPIAANGIRFDGYAIERQPDKLRVLQLLHVLSLPPQGQDYHWYNHVLNVQGQKVAQLDGGGIHPSNWRVGDTLIQWFDIPMNVEQLQLVDSLRIGIYEYPNIKPIMLQLSDGKQQDGITLLVP